MPISKSTLNEEGAGSASSCLALHHSPSLLSTVVMPFPHIHCFKAIQTLCCCLSSMPCAMQLLSEAHKKLIVMKKDSCLCLDGWSMTMTSEQNTLSRF